MPREKFQLSETLRVLAHKVNALVSGGEGFAMRWEVPPGAVRAGATLAATAVVSSSGEARSIEFVLLRVRGSVQRGGAWRDYEETVEVAQGASLGADESLAIPIELAIPIDAVPSSDGADWSVEGRVVVSGQIDARAREALTIEAVSATEVYEEEES